MSFFDSEVVQAEMSEISDLQEQVCGTAVKFYSMSKEDKINHINLMKKLLSKQQIFYTRLSLSDDSEAKKIKQSIAESAVLMGLPSNVDINIIFNDMNIMLESMQEYIDEI